MEVSVLLGEIVLEAMCLSESEKLEELRRTVDEVLHGPRTLGMATLMKKEVLRNVMNNDLSKPRNQAQKREREPISDRTFAFMWEGLTEMMETTIGACEALFMTIIEQTIDIMAVHPLTRMGRRPEFDHAVSAAYKQAHDCMRGLNKALLRHRNPKGWMYFDDVLIESVAVQMAQMDEQQRSELFERNFDLRDLKFLCDGYAKQIESIRGMIGDNVHKRILNERQSMPKLFVDHPIEIAEIVGFYKKVPDDIVGYFVPIMHARAVFYFPRNIPEIYQRGLCCRADRVRLTMIQRQVEEWPKRNPLLSCVEAAIRGEWVALEESLEEKAMEQLVHEASNRIGCRTTSLLTVGYRYEMPENECLFYTMVVEASDPPLIRPFYCAESAVPTDFQQELLDDYRAKIIKYRPCDDNHVRRELLMRSLPFAQVEKLGYEVVLGRGEDLGLSHRTDVEGEED